MKHLLNHKITIYQTITKNEYNEETFGSPKVFCGRFHLKNKLINNIIGANNMGESIMADAMCYLTSDAEVSIGTKIVFNNIAYRVLQVLESLNDVSNKHHIEIWVQKWEQ